MPEFLTTEEKATVDAMVCQVRELNAARDAELAKSLDQRDNDLVSKFEKLAEEQMSNLKEYHDNSMKAFRLPGLESAEKNPKEGFSWAKAAWAISRNDFTDAPVELEVKQNMMAQGAYEKAMALGSGTGNFIVPEEQSEEVIDRLRAQAVVFQLGATRLDGLDRSPYTFPRLDASVTASWGAEASTITASDPTLAQVSMSPKELKSLNTYSNTLLRTSHPSIDALIRDDMAKQHALGLDLGALTGDGSSGAPTGITNSTNVGDSTLSSTPTYNELQDFVATVRNSDALMGNVGWALSPEALNSIIQMPDGTTTQPLQRRLLDSGPMERLLGYPFFTTSQLPNAVATTDSVVFGNFSDLMIGFWGAMEIVASIHSQFATTQTQIRGVLYCDAAVRHGESFCHTT